MKKIYMIVSVVALCAGVNMPSLVSAQGKLNGEFSLPSDAIRLDHSYVLNPPVDNSRTVSGKWLYYWLVEDSLAWIATGGPTTPSVSYAEPLFPDSFVVICSDPSSCGLPQVHLIGNVLDPNSADMQSTLGYDWNNANPYWVDSLSLVYCYTRNSDPSIVDTLVAYLLNDSADTYITDTVNNKIDTVEVDLPIYSYYGGFWYNSYGDSSVFFSLLLYDSTSTTVPMPRSVTPGIIQTFKIPLTIADTATPGVNANTMIIDTKHFSVPAGKLTGSAFGFIPGYTYAPGDTISNTNNAFYFITDAPNGDNVYPPYTPGDWNVSEIVDNDGRYQHNPGQFNLLFMPVYSFYTPYEPQEHRISYYVTGTFDVGIKESISSEGTKLYQNQPNPANHTTLIKYETKSSSPVTFEVRDITGRLLMEVNQGIQSAGTHAVTIDVSKLSQGMYTYTLKTNNESLTRRMVIAE